MPIEWNQWAAHNETSLRLEIAERVMRISDVDKTVNAIVNEIVNC